VGVPLPSLDLPNGFNALRRGSGRSAAQRRDARSDGTRLGIACPRPTLTPSFHPRPQDTTQPPLEKINHFNSSGSTPQHAADRRCATGRDRDGIGTALIFLDEVSSSLQESRQCASRREAASPGLTQPTTPHLTSPRHATPRHGSRRGTTRHAGTLRNSTGGIVTRYDTPLLG
jgi:hypothetical protein